MKYEEEKISTLQLLPNQNNIYQDLIKDIFVLRRTHIALFITGRSSKHTAPLYRKHMWVCM